MAAIYNVLEGIMHTDCMANTGNSTWITCTLYMKSLHNRTRYDFIMFKNSIYFQRLIVSNLSIFRI